MTPDSRALQPLADDATALLKALAHPARLMICCELRARELAVGDIEATLGIRQPRLSRELAKLREEGFVETRRESKVVFYALADNPRVRGMVDAICGVMLGRGGESPARSDTRESFRTNRAGGYGVFARTTK